jgi:hypothetical protein
VADRVSTSADGFESVQTMGTEYLGIRRANRTMSEVRQSGSSPAREDAGSVRDHRFDRLKGSSEPVGANWGTVPFEGR